MSVVRFPEFLQKSMLDGIKKELRMYKSMLQELFDWDQVDEAAASVLWLEKLKTKHHKNLAGGSDGMCATRLTVVGDKA